MIKVSLFQGETAYGPSAVPLFGPADSTFEKVAAPALLPEVSRYIETLRPVKDSQYVLVNAMGASEFYGANVNGDAFNEESLIHAPDDWTHNPLIDKIRAKAWPYGYPTFYLAHPYAHHRNKDSTRAFGEVELAAWNPSMHRVELVARVDKEKCEKFGGIGVWDKLQQGQFPDVSMGTKVPFDTCSICLDWKRYRDAQASFDPKKHSDQGACVLAIHKKHPIRGVSITRKDYCFPPGTPILLADGSSKNIEDIHVGDEVLSHMGVARPVTHLLPSTGLSTLVQIDAWGFLPIQATDNHPFLSSRPLKKRARMQNIDEGVGWVAAGELQEGDIVLCPLPRVTDASPMGAAYGFLLGLYLAEGGVNFSTGVAHPKSTCFTVHGSERALLEEAGLAGKCMDLEGTEKYRAYSEKNAIELRINSRRVAEWLLQHGGRGSRTKSLSPVVWQMGMDFCRQVLRGWAAGDGSYDKRTGVLRVATSSLELAKQMQLLAAACGVVGALHRYDRTTNYGDQTIWYLGFSGDAASAIRETRAQCEFAQQSKLFLWNGYLATSIRKLAYEEYNGPLYNFEVEEDHSYVAGSYAVHNCEHALRQMNKILPDGRKVFVYNDYPKFFDISFVFIGADRTAKVMMKLAGDERRLWSVGSAEVAEKLGYDESAIEKIASVMNEEELIKGAFLGKLARNKQSEIVKDVPSQFASKAVPALTKCEAHIPDALLDILGKAPLEQALSTPTALGIVLRPREFQRIMLIQIGEGALADKYDREDTVFPKSSEHESVPMGPEHVSPVLARLLASLIGGRSGFGPSIEKRVLVISKNHSQEKTKTSSLSSNLLRKMGAAYNGYRKSVMELVAHSQELMSSEGMPSDSYKLASVSVDVLFTPLSVQYFGNAFMDEVGTSETEKTSSVERGNPSRNTSDMQSKAKGQL